MDETNQPVNQSPVPSPTGNEKLVVAGPRNYFWVALAALLFGGVVIIGIVLWNNAQGNAPTETTPNTTATSSAQINSSAGLDSALQQLDNTNFTVIQNNLNQNDQAAAKF